MNKSAKFVIYTPQLNFKTGGIVVLHKLAHELIKRGCQTFLFVYNGAPLKNDFCNDFASLQDLDEATIVIYPETIEGNPLNAKNVVRWMLCDLGVHGNKEIFQTWGLDDLVFHYSSFNPIYGQRPLEMLLTSWMDPKVKNYNLPRSGSCYLFKKASRFHQEIQLNHPKDAILIDQCSMEEIIEIFNQKEYFYCYDPYSFYDTIALACGCIPIIYPLANVSRKGWLKTRTSYEIILQHQEDVSGIAYGIEGIGYAKETLINASKEQQWVADFENQCIDRFILKTDAYFIKNEHANVNNTVAKTAEELNWNATLPPQLKELQIQSLSELTKKQQYEIDWMKSSKFWKMRQFLQTLIKF